MLIIKNNLPQHTLIFYLHTAIIIIIFPFFHSRIFIYFLLLSPAQVQLNRNLRIIPLWVSLYSNSFYDDILKRSAAREEKIYCYDGFNLQLYHSYVFFYTSASIIRHTAVVGYCYCHLRSRFCSFMGFFFFTCNSLTHSLLRWLPIWDSDWKLKETIERERAQENLNWTYFITSINDCMLHLGGDFQCIIFTVCRYQS